MTKQVWSESSSLLCRTTLALLIALLAFAPAARAGEQCFVSAEYSPAAVGDTWNYLENGRTSVNMTVVSDTDPVGEIETTRIEIDAGEGRGWQNVSFDSAGTHLHRVVNTTSQGGTINFSPPALASEPVQCIGEPVTSDGRGTILLSGLGTYSMTYSTSITLTGTDRVTVLAGTFDTVVSEATLTIALKVQGQTIRVTEIDTVHSARHVGAVHQEARADGEIVTHELVAYSVPEPEYETGLAAAVGALLALRVMHGRRGAGDA
jgi:hypothetical protein